MFCWLMRGTVSAMPPICRNWQNAYIISFSKGLDAPRVQAAICISRSRASIDDLVAVVGRNLSVSLEAMAAERRLRRRIPL